jgi:hypothetical protein
MTDPNTTAEMEAYVGKIFEQDFTRADLEQAFPKYDVFISNKNKLALAGFRPDRLRVWLNDDNTVAKVVTG